MRLPEVIEPTGSAEVFGVGDVAYITGAKPWESCSVSSCLPCLIKRGRRLQKIRIFRDHTAVRWRTKVNAS